MKLRAMFPVLLAAACLLGGCQSAPGSRLTVEEDADGGIAATCRIDRYDAPLTYTDVFAENGFSIRYDAAVSVPAVDALPLYTYQNGILTQTMLSELTTSLFGNQTVYAQRQTTKEEYADEYLSLRQLLESIKNNPDQSDGSAEEIEDEMAEVAEAMRNAPKEDSLRPVEVLLNENDGFRSFYGRAFVDDAEYDLSVTNTDDYFRLLFERGIGNRYVPISEYYPEADVSSDLVDGITKDDAQEIANAYFETLGVQDMALSGYAVGLNIGEAYSYEGPQSLENPLAHIFIYTRQIDGIPITYDCRDSAYQNEYAPLNYYDRLEIAVSQRGLEDIKWLGLMELGEKYEDDVPILSFEDVIACANNGLCCRYAADDSEDPYRAAEGDVTIGCSTGVRIDITKITFGYMQRFIPDENGTYDLIPVWDFFGDVTCSDDHDGSTENHDPQTSIITVNAMDGSIVDRDLGY